MSVYVGIDVHRKRSQVAVVTGDGTVQLNKNVVNGSEPMLRLIGELPSGTPVAFEAAFGWSWLAELLEDYGFEAHLKRPLGDTFYQGSDIKFPNRLDAVNQFTSTFHDAGKYYAFDYIVDLASATRSRIAPPSSP